MQITQIQVSGDAIQDRLLLRILTSANEEIRVWFTRRFLKAIWPHLPTSLYAPPPTSSEQAETSLGSFDEPYQEKAPLFPLGSQPLLVSEVSFERKPDNLRLTLREARERSCQIVLDAHLLSAFRAMLTASAETLEWHLPLREEKPAVAEEPAPPASTAPNKQLH